MEVTATVTDRATMRAAMDPANQSLGEALLLSYRILQLAILGLVFAFLFSGFQTVQEGYTGVRTIFGATAGDPGEESITPGLHPFWPYPIGEITVFPQRQSVDLKQAFWVELRSIEITLEQATENADLAQPIRPSRTFGSLITADGDIAHLQLTAEFVIEDPVLFLERFAPADADRVVKAALKTAAVQTAAQSTLAELVEQRNPPSAAIQSKAQAFLDGLSSGIKFTSVQVPERIAPLAIRNTFRRVQTAREDAKTAVEKARQKASSMLVDAAGPGYADLLVLIRQYEIALMEKNDAVASEVLVAIANRLQGADIGGDAAKSIQRARAAQASLEAALGRDARRLASLSASFHENPKQLVRQLWLQALTEVLSGNEAEVFSIPADTGLTALHITSSQDVMQTRRTAELDRKKRMAEMIGMDAARRFQLGGSLITIDGPGRRLDSTGQKGFGKE
ncbi:MAG: SPFH domain-containing protein [Planctomycetota bacterium]|nr:SPFH domain-containing protein [Planctomycetota bacterium]